MRLSLLLFDDTNARKQCREYGNVGKQSPFLVAAHERVHYSVVDRNRVHSPVVDRNRVHYDTDAHKQSRYCVCVHVLVCARAGERLTFPGLGCWFPVRPLASALALALRAGIARG